MQQLIYLSYTRNGSPYTSRSRLAELFSELIGQPAGLLSKVIEAVFVFDVVGPVEELLLGHLAVVLLCSQDVNDFVSIHI